MVSLFKDFRPEKEDIIFRYSRDESCVIFYGIKRENIHKFDQLEKEFNSLTIEEGYKVRKVFDALGDVSDFNGSFFIGKSNKDLKVKFDSKDFGK